VSVLGQDRQAGIADAGPGAGGSSTSTSRTHESREDKPHKPSESREDKPHKPSEVSGKVGIFDRFAGRTADIVSRAPFFAFCVVLLVVWAPTILFLNLDTWQLLINTATTIITFLMVALLQNTQTRNDQATQHKLNAVADALADLMQHVGGDDPKVTRDVQELKDAVGLEDRETTD
jgi:low affinity Fe/Cu permease